MNPKQITSILKRLAWLPLLMLGGAFSADEAFRLALINRVCEPEQTETSAFETCQRLADGGVTINRPPRDGHMAFVRSPDGISIELLQKGEALPKAEPWASMENTGSW